MKGHVYKRGKNWSYLFDIEPDPLTGKRRQANGSGYRTEREAWKACRDAMAEYEKGRVVSSSRRKVGGGAGRVADPDRALDQAVHGPELAELRRLLRDPVHRAA